MSLLKWCVTGFILVGAAFAVAQQSGLSGFYTGFSASEHELDEQAHVRAERQEELIEQGGMEPRKCGFHIVTPPLPHGGDPLFDGTSSSETDRWAFDYLSYFSLDDYPRHEFADIQASFERVFPNAVASLGLTQLDGMFALEAVFTPRGLGVIRTIHGPTDSATPFRDWFSESHMVGGAATNMTCALIHNDTAFTPFSVTELLRTGGTTAIVARSLTLEQAESILAAYEN